MKIIIITILIMKSENKEIFIPGPCGRIQAKYYKSKQQNASVALVLQPHPQLQAALQWQNLRLTIYERQHNGVEGATERGVSA